MRTVVAADFSPGRRASPRACGADVVVDPGEDSPYTAADGDDHLTDAPAAFELAVGTREKLERLPIGWWHAWRLAEALGAGPKHPVVFECVGAPGVIESIIEGAPLFSRVVVVGVCVGADRFTPALAINKEIDLRFVLAYTPLEFRDTLHMLSEGKIDPRRSSREPWDWRAWMPRSPHSAIPRRTRRSSSIRIAGYDTSVVMLKRLTADFLGLSRREVSFGKNLFRQRVDFRRGSLDAWVESPNRHRRNVRCESWCWSRQPRTARRGYSRARSS